MTPATDPQPILDRLLALHPKVIDLSLERMHRILAALGHPERALPPVFHIAGTNGKGSTGALLRAGLTAAGRRVHVYTSPHLVRFNERIRLDGALIDDEALSAILGECETANGATPITYFEITTAAALLAFSRRPADALILEVGLGGRLDATNVIDRPAVTVVTPVSMDHMGYLGDRLSLIAGEKAGILKPGVPAVIAPQHPDALAVIEARAQAVGAPLYRAGREWTVTPTDDGFHFRGRRWDLFLPALALTGHHQIDNAGTALAALEQHLDQPPADLAAALGAVRWPARLQELPPGPLADLTPAACWLDGGHNPAAAQALATVIAHWPQPVDAICGMIGDREPASFLAPLAPHLNRLTAVPVPGQAAGQDPADLAAAASALGLSADTAPDVATALKGRDAARVLICGSLYLAGAVLAANGPLPD